MKLAPKYKGILFILVSAFCFACMNACVRLAGDVPTFQKSFFRNLVALIIATVMLLREGGGFRPASSNRWRYLLARSVCGTVGILCNFYAVDHLILSDASMLNKMSPFFAIIVSFFLLGERLTLVQLVSVAGAFLGALCIIKPSFANLDLFPSLIGLLGGLGAGIAYSFVRLMGKKGERGSYIVFVFSAFSCLVTLPYFLAVHAPMTLSQLLWLIGAGACGAGGQFGITAAYCCAPARELSVYDYSQVIFAAVIGFFLFGDRPDWLSFLGYVLIIGMAALTFWYNNYYLPHHDQLLPRK
jgi:drug/metabolite transporter (DMT)-like permease